MKFVALSIALAAASFATPAHAEVPLKAKDTITSCLVKVNNPDDEWMIKNIALDTNRTPEAVRTAIFDFCLKEARATKANATAQQR